MGRLLVVRLRSRNCRSSGMPAARASTRNASANQLRAYSRPVVSEITITVPRRGVLASTSSS